MNASAAPARTSETGLHLFVKETRRSNMSKSAILRPLNTRIQQSAEYEMIDINDFMTGMTNPQQHNFLLKMHDGMSNPILSYTWSRGGSRAGVKPHVIWRIPLKSQQEQRAEGVRTSQNNIDYLKKKQLSITHEQSVPSIWLQWLTRTS